LTLPLARARALLVDAPGDAALLEAIARDDVGALGTLFDRHAQAVWRVLHRVTNGANDVDDLVHTTFLKVPQLAKSFDGRVSARSWLIGIGVRLATRQSRSLARFARMLTRFGYVTPHADRLDPEVQAAGRARIATLAHAIAKLSAAKRVAFTLIELEGLAPDEVARVLEIPAATVRTRLFHAKTELRTALEAKEGR
jgi:RNA polymerase sigma-70 factor (ECF subfamily)